MLHQQGHVNSDNPTHWLLLDIEYKYLYKINFFLCQLVLVYVLTYLLSCIN